MLKLYKPTSEGLRSRKSLVREVDNVAPLKSHTYVLKAAPGRSRGRISSRHKQRGAKKMYRLIDFKRDKYNIPAMVSSIEYDPNRGVSIALLSYIDGEKRYILAPEGLHKGMRVVSGNNVEVSVGNSLPMSEIPLGVEIHNLEINPGQGGVLS